MVVTPPVTTPPVPPYTVSSAYLFTLRNSSTVKVLRLTDMSRPGFCRGAVYVPWFQTVYVFGGTRDGQRADRWAEKYELREGGWRGLGEMREARMCLNPCWHTDQIYLCGGYHNSIELFNLQTEEYTPWWPTPFPLPETVSFYRPKASSLVLLSTQKVVVIEGRGVREAAMSTDIIAWSRSTPVVWKGFVYITRLGFEKDGFKGCYQIEVGSGEVQRYSVR